MQQAKKILFLQFPNLAGLKIAKQNIFDGNADQPETLVVDSSYHFPDLTKPPFRERDQQPGKWRVNNIAVSAFKQAPRFFNHLCSAG